MSSKPPSEGRAAHNAARPDSLMGAATLQRLRDCYIATIDWLSRATGMIAALLLAISILVISEMIFVRYILNESTYWQTEFVVYSITATTLVGSPYVLLTNGHVAVTLFPDAIGGRGGRLIQFFGQIAGFCFSALLAYSGWYYFLETYINGWTSDTIWAIHMWIPVSAMPLGLTLLTLQYLAEMVRPRHEE